MSRKYLEDKAGSFVRNPVFTVLLALVYKPCFYLVNCQYL